MWYRLLFAVLLAASILPARAQEADTLRHDYLRMPIDVSVWRNVSLSRAVLGADTTRPVLQHLALNLPLGVAARLEGVSVGLFGSVYTREAYGVQVSGLGNVVGKRLAGVQVAGLGNVVGESGLGVQMAGLGNIAGERFAGVQNAGLGNVAGGSFAGIQSAGLANIAGDAFAGVQMAGLANVAGEGVTGLQAAGLANIAGGGGMGLQVAGLANISGEGGALLQVSGLANIAGGPMRGAQIGPFNIASDARGLQVGLVNVAGSHSGVPVGLLSRVGGVPVHAETWADETGALHVGVLSGSAVVTNRFGVAVRPFGGGDARFGAFFGVGVVQPLAEGATWGVEATAQSVLTERLGNRGGVFQLRAPLGYALSPSVSVFGGPSLNLYVADTDRATDLAPYTLFERTGETLVQGWIGGFAGLRLRVTRD